MPPEFTTGRLVVGVGRGAVVGGVVVDGGEVIGGDVLGGDTVDGSEGTALSEFAGMVVVGGAIGADVVGGEVLVVGATGIGL